MCKEICICAGIKINDQVIRGHRHHDCFESARRRGISDKITSKMQGFVTSKNRFVNRETGALLQREAGVLSVWTGKEVKDLLFSEDLY